MGLTDKITGRDKQAEDDAPDNEDGTATGNPNAAG
jgi:hypothetical protein